MSNDTDTRVVATAANGSATALTSGVTADVAWTTTEADTHGAFGGTTYTAPVPGWYDFSTQFRINTSGVVAGTSNAQVILLKNGATTIAQQTEIAWSTSSTSFWPKLAKLVYLLAGETIKVQLNVTATTPTISGTASNNLLNIKRISGPSAIAASETVAARYSTNTALSIASASTQFMDFEDKDYDTHGMVLGAGSNIVGTTNTGFRAVAPIAGKYHVDISVQFDSATFTATTLLEIEIMVDNVSKASFQQSVETTGTRRFSLHTSTDVSLTAGQRVEIIIFHNEGTARLLRPSGSYNTFTIRRVGN